MKQPSLDHAITTAELCQDLGHPAGEDPKCGTFDLLFSAGQVGTVLGLCWMVHCFV